jgi:hypothetical protein
MSAKWKRVQRWDDEHIPSWAWPVKAILRAFSSIALAVVLLTCVALYGVLASVPIGMLALGVTWAFYIATLLAVMAITVGIPLVIVRYGLKNAGRGLRFTASLGGVVLGSIAGWFAWSALAWPSLHYDPLTGDGVRFFSGFVQQYQSITLRRLPAVEMTELEFYSWWPMRIILLLFVINMITATVRRIEFTFKNIGVLTVHTGIVTIALGSIYYQGLKKEGDAILLAGVRAADGSGTPGQPTVSFYDNTYVVLYVAQRPNAIGQVRYEQRPLHRMPRYNDYNVGAGPKGEDSHWVASMKRLPWLEVDEATRNRTLDRPVPAPQRRDGAPSSVDPDINIRLVGYVNYAEMETDLIRSPAPMDRSEADPLRVVKLYADPAILGSDPDAPGSAEGPKTREDPTYSFSLRPSRPATRVSDQPGFIGVEYTRDLSDERWALLSATLPTNTTHALRVEVDAIDGRPAYQAWLPTRVGASHVLGDSGYTLVVNRLHDTPPFPIITAGYEGAQSSVAEINLLGPPDAYGERETVQRYVYSRFPEIDQELLPDQLAPSGMPARRDPDPAVRISYLDAKQLQLYLDEREDGSIRAIVREPGSATAKVIENLGTDDQGRPLIRDAVQGIDFRVTHKWAHTEEYLRPVPVPEVDRDNELVGSHQRAAVAVEVSIDRTTPSGAQDTWSKTIWVPFAQYLLGDASSPIDQIVELPDGRPPVRIGFGRRQHALPGFQLRLIDFEMIAYDHRGAPRDYQSIVRVESGPSAWTGQTEQIEPYTHAVTLNAPLTAPFHWNSSEASWPVRMFNRLLSGLDPNQYKLSQAGWDAQGWERTQGQADAGLIPAPFAQFTILGVGNNPGIHVIAFGGILMGVGIPWAFYVKPWLLKREKAMLAAMAMNQPKPDKRSTPSTDRSEPAALRASTMTEPETQPSEPVSSA